MVGSGMFDGLFTGLITIGILGGLLLWGIWETIDWLFIEDVDCVESILIVEELIEPEIKLYVKDNVVDTLYVYRTKQNIK